MLIMERLNPRASSSALLSSIKPPPLSLGFRWLSQRTSLRQWSS